MIQLENIVKTYQSGRGTVCALNGVSLTVGKNEFVSIMGKSGCGKSTLLNLIGTLDSATGGSYRLSGEDVSSFSKTKKALIRSAVFGFVFQAFHLIPEKSALENVMLPLRYGKRPKKEWKEAALSALSSLGMEELADKRPPELSGGEQQRVAIARAIVGDSDVLLCDEPTGNLDDATGKMIMELFTKLHQELGKTIILVTHDLKVSGYAERIIEMRDGRVALDLQCREERSSC